MPDTPKPFGRRAPPKIEPPKIQPSRPIFHAPQGLGGPEPHDKRRLRSFMVFLSAFGVATICGLALVDAVRARHCRDAKPNDPNAQADCSSSGGGHGGGGGHWSSGGGQTSPTSFGGFGATGEGGAHGGGGEGGHGGGGHGGGGGE